VVTGLQIRAARGFLAWDRRDLAKKAVVAIYAIERIETGAEISGTAMVKGLAAVQAALEAEGIELRTIKKACSACDCIQRNAKGNERA
jgi:hypothetical protein